MRRRGEKFGGREVGGFPAQQTRVPAALNLARLRTLPAPQPLCFWCWESRLRSRRGFAGDNGNCPLGGTSAENYTYRTLSTPASIPNEGQGMFNKSSKKEPFFLKKYFP